MPHHLLKLAVAAIAAMATATAACATAAARPFDDAGAVAQPIHGGRAVTAPGQAWRPRAVRRLGVGRAGRPANGDASITVVTAAALPAGLRAASSSVTGKNADWRIA